jgi:hypothetical protein
MKFFKKKERICLFSLKKRIDLRNTFAGFLLATTFIGSQIPLAYAMESDDKKHRIPNKIVKLKVYTENLDNEDPNLSSSFCVSLSENAADFCLLSAEEGMKIMQQLFSQAYPKSARMKDLVLEIWGKENRVWICKKADPHSSIMTFREISGLLAANATSEEGVFFLAENTRKARPPLTKERLQERRQKKMQEEREFQEMRCREIENLQNHLHKISLQSDAQISTIFANLREQMQKDFASTESRIENLKAQFAAEQLAQQQNIQSLSAQVISLEEQANNIEAQTDQLIQSMNNLKIENDKNLKLENNAEDRYK